MSCTFWSLCPFARARARFLDSSLSVAFVSLDWTLAVWHTDTCGRLGDTIHTWANWIHRRAACDRKVSDAVTKTCARIYKRRARSRRLFNLGEHTSWVRFVRQCVSLSSRRSNTCCSYFLLFHLQSQLPATVLVHLPIAPSPLRTMSQLCGALSFLLRRTSLVTPLLAVIALLNINLLLIGAFKIAHPKGK